MRGTLMAIAVLLTLSSFVHACDITVKPEKDKVLVGDTIKIIVNVHLTHRKCVLPIDETEVEVTNGRVLSNTPWKKTGRMDRQSIYTIVIEKSGKNKIHVTRICSREGLSEGIGYLTATYTRERAIARARYLLGEIAEGRHIKTNADMLNDIVSWIKSQKDVDEELKTVASMLEKVVIASKDDLSKARSLAAQMLSRSPFKEKQP